MHAFPGLLFLLLNLAWGSGEIALSLRRRSRGGSRDAGTLRLLLRTLYGAVALGVALSFTGWGRFPDEWIEPLRWCGCALLGIGMALRLWAIRVLDRWFTVDVAIQAGQRLVRHGPYRRLRHPSYTGALLCFYGLALGLGNLPSLLAIVLASSWAFARRIAVEEAVLADAFGTEWDDYAASRKRLWPGVW